MSRSTRNTDQFPLHPVADYEVAPHRYRYDQILDYENETDYYAFKAGIPYKVGEVVYVLHHGKLHKALITGVRVERNRFDDWREKFRVHLSTKTGEQFSKNWLYTYPGMIQRGYRAAGLAPDVPE